MALGPCPYCSLHWNRLSVNLGNDKLADNLLRAPTKKNGFLASIFYVFILGPIFIPAFTLALKLIISKYTNQDL